MYYIEVAQVNPPETKCHFVEAQSEVDAQTIAYLQFSGATDLAELGPEELKLRAQGQTEVKTPPDPAQLVLNQLAVIDLQTENSWSEEGPAVLSERQNVIALTSEQICHLVLQNHEKVKALLNEVESYCEQKIMEYNREGMGARQVANGYRALVNTVQQFRHANHYTE